MFLKCYVHIYILEVVKVLKDSEHTHICANMLPVHLKCMCIWFHYYHFNVYIDTVLHSIIYQEMWVIKVGNKY